MALNQFVNSGTDEATVQDMKKSIAREEDLQKAMNKAGLVQKEVQVKGKNGQTFTRKQWVKASEDSIQPQSTSATEKPASKGKDDVMQKWKDKVDAGNFTDDVKKELKYGIDTKAAALVEKDGKYKTAKTWDEADYANQQGWKTVDSITSIINNGKLPDNKSSQPANQSDTNSIEYKLDKTKSGKVGAVWSIESNGKKESATVVNKIPDGYRKHTDITVEGRNFTIYTNGNDLLATEKTT